MVGEIPKGLLESIHMVTKQSSKDDVHSLQGLVPILKAGKFEAREKCIT